jgi:PPE-repeat protein
MWAQDATAMYGYAADSAAAANVTQFTTPAQTTNPAGQAMQSAAVALASGTAAGTAQSTLSQWMSQLTGLLGQLASPTTVAKDLGLTPASSSLTQIAFDPSTIVGSMLAGIGGNANLNPSWFITAFRNFAGPAYNLEGLVSFSTGISNTLVSLQKALTPAAAAAAAAAKPAADAAAGLLGGGHGGIGGGGIAAGLGQAASVGKLSVPAAWSDAGPALSHAATPRPIAITSAATPEAASPGSLLGGMPLAAAKAGASISGPRYGLRPTVMARPPFAG